MPVTHSPRRHFGLRDERISAWIMKNIPKTRKLIICRLSVLPPAVIQSNPYIKTWTVINIRWLNAAQVKYCSLLFTSHTASPLISNPPFEPSDNTGQQTHCMEFHAALSRCVINPTVHSSKHHIKGRHRGCLKATGQRRVRGQTQAGGSREECRVGWIHGSPFLHPQLKSSNPPLFKRALMKNNGEESHQRCRKRSSETGSDVGACSQTYLSDVPRKKLHIRCTAALSVWHFCYKFLLNGEERHNEFESSLRVMWHLMFVLLAIIHISHSCSDASSLACCMHCYHWLIFMLTLLVPPTDFVKYLTWNKGGLLAFMVTPSIHVAQTDLSTDLITSSHQAPL